MNSKHVALIAHDLQRKEWQIEHAITLLEDGATIPFISRYRKEATGSLDEVQLAQVKMLWEKYDQVDKRRTSILHSIEEQGKLTPELRASLENCWQLNLLEDLYLPYKPKRRTRASVARENGLEPLAARIQQLDGADMEACARAYVNDKVASPQEALAGARDIIAESVAETAPLRQRLRYLYQTRGSLVSKVVKGKEEDGNKYSNYFDVKERIQNMAPHRLLAMLRAQAEGFVTVKLDVDADQALYETQKACLPPRRAQSYPMGAASSVEQYKLALADAWKRLIHPSLENEVINQAKERADVESVKVFDANLQQLLLAPPLGQKRVLAIDPGFRTGCKVVCLDAQGNLLHNDTIYPHPPQNERSVAMRKLTQLVESYKIEVVAIGSGTAGRETEQFLKKIAFPHKIQCYSVSEDGASVYSASPLAREEFPQYDVTVRGAVSIGRRLMDPLAELVKIDPKSLGVGQYQHDVNQTLLKDSLDQTVAFCVNRVGVNLNTASKQLLTYVSGLGPSLAQNIVDYRAEHGAFASRNQLKDVKRLGDKAFEQCAGFLRIANAENVLDNSAVHPESYPIVERMASDLGVTVEALVAQEPLRKKIALPHYVTDTVGLPTLQDIMTELDKPGRDPRSAIKVLEFDDTINAIEDLHEGMVLPGIVTNVTNFGAFVSIGIKQDGLVHVSQMGPRRVSNPLDVLKLHQHVTVRVLRVDLDRKRIQLALVK